ncbi:MAG TPA: DNA ligase D [Longimicrobium sp.]|nr:DNA ligase D [Longimicrobium sp.]
MPPAPDFSPMLATSAAAPPAGGEWTFEPKYDGIRALAIVTTGSVALLTRNGNDKCAQFPEVVAALHRLRRACGCDLVLDGEIVALHEGRVMRFEALAGRMHIENRRAIARLSRERPAAYVAFDVLLAGRDPLLHQPWTTRRPRLEELLRGRQDEQLRLGDTSPDAEGMMERARAERWEGLIAKRTTSPYRPGLRSRDWLKVKLMPQEEFVIGGWTDPTNAARGLGALMLGEYGPDGRLRYVGHTGKGFSERMLRDLHARLRGLERATSPFDPRPRLVQAHHWAEPELVAEIRYAERTTAGKLRDSTFLGLRPDRRGPDLRPGEPGLTAFHREAGNPPADAPEAGRILTALREMEDGGGASVLEVDGAALEMSGLARPMYPGSPFTRGDLLRYYAAMAPFILPAMRDRPLAVAYFPGSPERRPDYRQSAPPDTPAGVRVEPVRVGRETKRMLVGGNLATLLFTIARGAISYDPWHARVRHPEAQDYVVLDLDPTPGAEMRHLAEAAHLAREVASNAGLASRVKTSGRAGLHVYVWMPPETPVPAACRTAERLAREMARRAPALATVERGVELRPRACVYVDYLMSRRGANVAGVYAARDTPHAAVSTPLAWDELTPGLDPRAFTIASVPARIHQHGDAWQDARTRRVANLPASLFDNNPA